MSSGMALPIPSQPSAPGLEHKEVWSTPRPCPTKTVPGHDYACLEETPDDQS
jgi:hypothetical protein